MAQIVSNIFVWHMGNTLHLTNLLYIYIYTYNLMQLLELMSHVCSKCTQMSWYSCEYKHTILPCVWFIAFRFWGYHGAATGNQSSISNGFIGLSPHIYWSDELTVGAVKHLLQYLSCIHGLATHTVHAPLEPWQSWFLESSKSNLSIRLNQCWTMFEPWSGPSLADSDFRAIPAIQRGSRSAVKLRFSSVKSSPLFDPL